MLGLVTATFRIPSVKAFETIYIHGDGSIEPSTAPIFTSDNITYTFTGNINSDTDAIFVERDNIVIDGMGYMVQGTWIGTGIDLSERTNITLKNMQIKAFDYGIYLWSSRSNTIMGVNITGSYWHGVSLYYSSYNQIIGNSITGNSFDAIHLSYSPLNDISRNSIVDNRGEGVYLSYSSGNDISGNNIADNAGGLTTVDSSSNRICHNNFVNNSAQACSEGSEDIWCDGYPSGGNYWSEYNGTDLCHGNLQNETGSDCIGDTPYIVDTNGVDEYPLMGLWTERGENVGVKHESGLSISFENVISSGITIVNETREGPNPPLGFKVAIQPPAYYEIKTTANYSGPVALSIKYDEQFETASLQLMHWNNTSQAWENITTSVDTVNNIAYGKTSSFSPFTLITRLLGDTTFDGIVDIYDAITLSAAYGSMEKSPNWNPEADLDGNGTVDIFDAIVLAGNYGQHYP